MERKKNLVIIGTSTTAKTVLEFVEYYELFNVLGFAINRSYISSLTFCDKPVYAIEDLCDIIDITKDFLFVAIQWNCLNADRRKVYEMLKKKGFLFANIISPNAILHGKISGDNCWIADQVNVDFGAQIGSNCFLKIQSFVASNCTIEDHCFIGAKSLIGGGSRIGEQTFVGLNATVFDCTVVGKKCIVGACSVVKRNMSDFSKIYTSVDNCQIKQYAEEEVESKLMFNKNIR